MYVLKDRGDSYLLSKLYKLYFFYKEISYG